MIELKEPFLSYWQHKDPFKEIDLLTGVIFRQVAERKTLQFILHDSSYFIKVHNGSTLREIAKNLITLRLPVIDSSNEWNAINHLYNNGVNTMHGVAFGKRGFNPLTRRSFIITEDLNPAVSLEEFTQSWTTHKPDYRLKKKLITELALTVRKMHLSGVNHRDCYLCHFLIKPGTPDFINNIKIFIIDLHRAQLRSRVPLRWRDKDLIGLYFSSSHIGLILRDVFLFMQVYFQQPLSVILQQEKRLIQTAVVKAEKIRARTELKGL